MVLIPMTLVTLKVTLTAIAKLVHVT